MYNILIVKEFNSKFYTTENLELLKISSKGD